MEAARAAVRAMIDHLGSERGLARADAYILCSLAGDLKITEVVDVAQLDRLLLHARRGVRRRIRNRRMPVGTLPVCFAWMERWLSSVQSPSLG